MTGLAAGGFLIDVDHAVDYVLVERQRDLRPGTFLRHYIEGRVRRTVLALHSWELFALLVALAWRTGDPWLVGYVAGGLMHLTLDLIFNGRYTPHSIVRVLQLHLSCSSTASTPLGSSVESPPRPRRRASFWHAFFGTTEARGPRARLDARTMRVLVVEDEGLSARFSGTSSPSWVTTRSSCAARRPPSARWSASGPTRSSSTSTCPG